AIESDPVVAGPLDESLIGAPGVIDVSGWWPWVRCANWDAAPALGQDATAGHFAFLGILAGH
ncbi:MAG TPA: hypothetical protein VHT26_02245, partial [Trebonia sp.]|nr:hypothetical protein [Trebonia sp.]